MKLTHLSVAHLERLIPLLKEKEALQAKLDHVDSQLRRLEGGTALTGGSAISKELVKPLKRKSKRKGGMQAAVLKALGSAGAKGMKVQELAKAAKVNPSSLNTWLYTAAKKIEGLDRPSPGLFVYRM